MTKAFLDFMMCNLCVGREISTTTFREGDKADTGRITVSQQLQRAKGQGYYIAPTTKSGKPRTIEPPPIAFEYLPGGADKTAGKPPKSGAGVEQP